MSASLAILSFYNVSTPVSGGALRVDALLNAVSPYSVRLIQPGGTHPHWPSTTFRPDFGHRRVGINWGMFNYFWPGTARLTRQCLEEWTPAGLVLTSIWGWAPFRHRAPAVPMVLDAQNVDGRAIGEQYGFRHPFTRLLARWERRVAHEAAHICVCSAVDKQGFIEDYGVDPDKITIVPNGSHVPSETELESQPLPDADLEQRLDGARVGLFVGGKLDYPPNAEGLKFLNEQVVPALESQRPGAFKVIVIGAPVPNLSFHPSVIPVGRVPSIDPYMRRADLCLAPIFSGSGTRLKVLDALAWRKPLVATGKAVEGIDCEPGTHYVHAGKETFADEIERLLGQPDERHKLAAAGRQRIQERYTWTASEAIWRDTFARVFS